MPFGSPNESEQRDFISSFSCRSIIPRSHPHTRDITHIDKARRFPKEGCVIKSTTRESAASQLKAICDDIVSGKATFEDVASRFNDCSSAKCAVILKLYDEVSQVVNDAVGNIRTVATFCAEKVMELYQKKCIGPIQTSIRQGLVSGTVVAMSQSGFMTPATSKAKNSASSVFAILDQKSRIDPGDEFGMTLQEVKGEIEFHHITFKYSTRPNVLVFKDLSLTIHAGELMWYLGPHVYTSVEKSAVAC
ncbi:ABC transporter B family member 11 [Spatholobus suberectus]|nr:ABC transporter B family member 11 [Spatholobus suberectus]